MPYAIRLKDVFYTEATPYPWTFDRATARTWDSSVIPENIVAYWNKVHYQTTRIVDDKERVLYSAIGGRHPKGATVVSM